MMIWWYDDIMIIIPLNVLIDRRKPNTATTTLFNPSTTFLLLLLNNNNNNNFFSFREGAIIHSSSRLCYSFPAFSSFAIPWFLSVIPVLSKTGRIVLSHEKWTSTDFFAVIVEWIDDDWRWKIIPSFSPIITIIIIIIFFFFYSC